MVDLDHKNLINSLKEKLDQENSSTVAKLENHVPVKILSGHGSLADNLKLITNYVCACGARTETLMHSFQSDNNGKALDSYHLNCKSCGQEERVSFHMLKGALKRTRDVPIFVKKNKLYPYI